MGPVRHLSARAARAAHATRTRHRSISLAVASGIARGAVLAWKENRCGPRVSKGAVLRVRVRLLEV